MQRHERFRVAVVSRCPTVFLCRAGLGCFLELLLFVLGVSAPRYWPAYKLPPTDKMDTLALSSVTLNRPDKLVRDAHEHLTVTASAKIPKSAN